LLFPTGRLPGPGWRIVAWVSAVPPLAFLVALLALLPYGGRDFLVDPSPFASRIPLGVALNLTFPLILVCGLASVVSVFVRLWRSRGVERQQLKWFAFAAAVSLGVIALDNVLPPEIAGRWLWLLVPFVVAVPLATGVAVLRYRLWDIDLIIRR